jgi:4,5:9,10-diseco-3-hydroxy-5,9,17-trioxoandrosta-1(10),2-diene-4-oate hydrolase
LPFFRTVAAELAAQSFAGRFAVCGNSLGGAIAAEMAAAAPQQVSHLALLAPAAFWLTTPLYVRLAGSPLGRAAFAIPPWRGFVAQAVSRAFADPSTAPIEMIDRSYALAREPAVRRTFARIYAAAQTDLVDAPAFRARLAQYTGPTFIGWGRHDRYLPISGLALAREVYPHASWEIFERSGHVPMIEEPAQVAAALRRLLGLVP